MTFTPITLPPGVIKTDSPYSVTGRWVDAEKVRFVRGLPEKIGGIQKLIDTSFTGVARGAKAWTDNGGNQNLLFGTACNLYFLREGDLELRTPYRGDATGITLTNPFTVTNGSAVVVVADTAHGIEEAGKYVTFDGASAVGGITIDGDYLVTEIIDANSYKVTHSSPATSSATGGGTVTASYEINCGDTSAEYLRGWGVGGWGEGYWGTEAPLSESVLSEPMSWSISTYGQNAIVNYLNGGVYYFDVTTSNERPEQIANSPAMCRFAFVTPERFIFALGCTSIFGGQDDMIVRWPDLDDFTDWTPTSVNRANERRLQGGTRLIGGTALSDVSLVWSNTACFLFQFNGGDTVYNSRAAGHDCGLIGPMAFCAPNGAAYWMGTNGFHLYNGYVQSIPNQDDIRLWVFDQLNVEQSAKCVCFSNSTFNEVWFIFPTTTDEPDTYVFVNTETFAWTNGTLVRTSATRYETGDGRPVMFGTDGYIYVHEVRENPDNDSAVMEAFVEMAPIDIEDGNTSVDIFGFVPDFERQSGSLTVELSGLDHPRDTDFMTDVLTVTPTDKLVDARSAGRQVKLKIRSNTLGGDFRLGRMGLEISGAGRKR